MWITLNLEPTGAGRCPLSFTWSPGTGEVAGTGAAFIRERAEEARGDGCMSHTPTGLYSEADPLTTWEGMAVLIAWSGYRVPAVMGDLLPVLDQPDHDGCDGAGIAPTF